MEHPQLFTLAAEQAGLFTWKQARAAGYSPRQIRARLADGRWRRVLGPTLAAGRHEDSPVLLDRAAYLAAAEPVVLSGPSAARAYGMAMGAFPPCITLPRSRHLTLPGVVQLRGRLDEPDAVVLDGLLVTSKARTTVDCLRLLPHDEALAFMDRALQQRWIAAESLLRRAADGDTRRGVEQLRALSREAVTGTHSEAERVAVSLLRAEGIEGWVANYEVRAGDSIMAIADVAFVAVRLAIELDGRAWHVDADQFQRDRRRQNALVKAGWTVLRYTWRDLTEEPDRVIAEIRHTLRILRLDCAL